jgi:uncharacterized protein (TIGR03435 family)
MPESDDITLLKEYAESGSESAFAELVARYINLVYSAALRGAGNPHAAQEITQAVFIMLARKAKSLGDKTVLSGWLYQTARLTAANYLRGEIRRQHREQEAYMQTILNGGRDASSQLSETEAWRQIAPLLDDAMGRLGEKDRNAIVLRFFENKNLSEVGLALGASEDAAKMRVNRALEKLRKFFAKRGVDSTAAILSGAISANSVHVAPVALAKSISAVALAKGAAASTSTLTLIKGALKIMAWTKAKTATVAGVIVLLAAGTTTVTVKEIQEHRTYPWQVPRADFNVFYESPPTMVIVPTKFAKDGGACSDGRQGAMGIAQPLKNIIQTAYGYDAPHTLVMTDLPTNRYDFMAKLVGPGMAQNRNWTVELQKKIARQFKFTGRVELRDTPALMLVPGSMGARGFKVSHSKPTGRGGGSGPTGIIYFDASISTLISHIQQRFQMPIIERTGLNEHYDFSLTWDDSDFKHPDLVGLKQALREQLGLELVATNLPVQMLVVEKKK